MCVMLEKEDRMNVLEIIRNHLENSGHHGLVNLDVPCGCCL